MLAEEKQKELQYTHNSLIVVKSLLSKVCGVEYHSISGIFPLSSNKVNYNDKTSVVKFLAS